MTIETHELKNRLAVALGYAQLLSRTELTQKQRVWVEQIVSACSEVDEMWLSTLAEKLGVSTRADQDSRIDIFLIERLEPALKRAVTILSDRRSGPGSLVASLAAGGYCSFCAARLAGSGIQLTTGSRLAGISSALESFPGNCEHYHVVASTDHDVSSVAIFPAGAPE